MNMKLKLATLLGSTYLLLLFSSSVQAQAIVINFVPDAAFNGSLNQATDVASGTTFSTAGGAGNSPISTGIDGDLGTSRGTFAPFTLTDGGFTGTFTLSFDISAINAAGNVGTVLRGAVGALGVPTNNLGLDPGESLTLSNFVLTNVSGDDVFQFDGFSGVFFGGVATGEDASINGITVDPPNSTSVFTAANLISFSDVTGVDSLLNTVTFGGGDTGGPVSILGVEAEFSAIPEPSSIALLALGGLALLLRRRRH